ncbi:MAG TPA: FmdB family zinc ribbon protein [Ktedonobacteraceae bacterium]|nr:FmdB family zinc ribbon protein [Ktedonobacteraceae bacterium]
MPTYEYVCNHCSHRFETWQKMSADPLTECPECGGHIRRVLFPAGIVFKGSGFYKTDHANGSTASENGHTPKSDEAGSTKEGESKPAPASESKSGESKSGEGKSGEGKSGENKVTVEAK